MSSNNRTKYATKNAPIIDNTFIDIPDFKFDKYRKRIYENNLSDTFNKYFYYGVPPYYYYLYPNDTYVETDNIH